MSPSTPNTLISPALTPHDVVRWAAPLAELLAVTGRRVDADFSPTWQSPAKIEITQTSAFTRADGSAWGEGPASTTTMVASMLLRAVLQHADAALLLLLARPWAAMPIEATVRNTLEAAAQAWWLLDPKISARARVVRRLMAQRATAQALEGSAASMGYGSAVGYGQTVTQADAERHALGVADDFGRKGGWAGCEGERLPSYTERVAAFMKETLQEHTKGPYAFVSGTAHAELWRMALDYTPAQAADGRTRWVPHTSANLVHFAVSACLDAVIQPAGRAFAWLGRGAALEELRRLEGPIKAAMRS